MKNDELKNVKKSILGEFNALSGMVALLVIGIVIISISSFIFMNRVPPKKVVIEDDAEIFTRAELRMLKKAAEELREEKDINVVIATTRDNPHGTTDEDCKKYAGEIYKEHCIPHPLQDNSGICIYIDLTLDYPGGRFFWLYTFGSAYFAVSNDECQQIFSSHKDLLSDGAYADAADGIMADLMGFEYHMTGLSVIYGCSIIIPLIIAFVIAFICTHGGKLDAVPQSSNYLSRKESTAIEKEDEVIRKSTHVYHTSSSSSGGFSGGFSGGGGGGGGHSGGGGGRF